jgi:DNA-binding Lrp family transcriptional regulator
MSLDELDKRIVQLLSVGISSYEDLARECKVTRNTVYRRMNILEKNGVIQKITRCVPNYEKLGVVAVFVAAEIAAADQKKALASIKADAGIKLLWRAYGNHNIVSIAFCNKGEEGQTIHRIKSILEGLNATKIKASVGYVWEKIDLTPFGYELEDQTSKEEALVASDRGLKLTLP